MAAFDPLQLARAVSIDELLSDLFVRLPGQKSDSELAASRLAAWCRSSASGDWSLFARRLIRDGLSIEDVLAKFATTRRNADALAPAWLEDAVWIADALQSSVGTGAKIGIVGAEPVPFEDLLQPVAAQADSLLWSGVDSGAVGEGARACLRRSLLLELANLAAPAIYECFAAAREDGSPAGPATARYDQFVSDMTTHGWRRLFEDKPVLLRLIASLTRQWIDTSRELIARLNTDLPVIRGDLAVGAARVSNIEGDLSDPHNFGRTVRVIGFDDGSRIVYKPKDLGVDAAWHALIERLNRHAPVELRAARVWPRQGYGWTEFIDHSSCIDQQGFRRFFRRAGAWLALFHCFVSVDMHQENIIASGEHPVPVDLEMILQGSETWSDPNSDDGHAFEAAMEKVINSVMTVGLLPAYGRHSNRIFSIGGVTSNSAPRISLTWHDINADTMRPAQVTETDTTISNLPHVAGHHARLADYIDDFVSGFSDYAMFLAEQSPDDLLDRFTGLTVRKVVRPTRFYAMQLHRMRNHRTMNDGVMWSAQADFSARLADWERDTDPAWPLQRAERAAVVELNIPHFVMISDGHAIRDAAGTSIPGGATSGLERARARVCGLDPAEIAWQTELIRQSTDTLGRAAAAAEPARDLLAPASGLSGRQTFAAAADEAARTLSDHAVRKGQGAAWIGLDWLGDSELSQLVVLGPDLYNGACGISLFLAAHAAVADATSSRTLAGAATLRLREILRGRNPTRIARLVGLGGGLGLGSIVYSLAVIAALLDDDEALCDAHTAAELITPDVISADHQLDVLGGSAGAILGLLRLYRQTNSSDILKRATSCGRHLLAQHRVGPAGRRSWTPPGSDSPLNGMSHGAAGFAYALASLAAATGGEEFSSAATECVAFENASFDPHRNNWPDLRGNGAMWRSKWCYGAPGIGLARAAMTRHPSLSTELVRQDVDHAVAGAEHGWPNPTDTLCCGTLGSIEFLAEAGAVLGRSDLREQASRRLLSVIETARLRGDYRWTSGTSRFNLGLFRGIAGVGYTALRRIEPSLPNVLIWE